MKPSEVIREARNVLFERGWTRRQLEHDDGSVCAMGALRIAAYGAVLGWGPEVESARDCLIAADAHLPDFITDEPSVPAWNDYPGRTFGEVIDAFDKAEKLALIAEESP